jgi:hypothetical protein
MTRQQPTLRATYRSSISYLALGLLMACPTIAAARPDFESPSPVTVITREEIEAIPTGRDMQTSVVLLLASFPSGIAVCLVLASRGDIDGFGRNFHWCGHDRFNDRTHAAAQSECGNDRQNIAHVRSPAAAGEFLDYTANIVPQVL